MSAVALGIDAGTSGCRLIAIDDDARVCGDACRAWPLPDRSGTTSTQSPTLWQSALFEALTDLGQTCSLSHLQGLAIDGTSGTVLATDSDGTPHGPALMYDHSEVVGPSRLLWLADRYGPSPDTLFFHQADWLTYQFTLTPGWTDEHNALKSGYDPLTESWPENIRSRCINIVDLPTVHRVGKPIQTINAIVARKLGLSETLKIVSGTTDSTAAILATGANQIGDAITSLGSTLVTKILATQPLFDPQRGIYSHRLNDIWIVGGASNSGGATLLQHFTLEQIVALSTVINPDKASGLNYYPLPATGERFPICDADKHNHTDPKPDDAARFLQGLFEGIANIEAHAYELLEQETHTSIQRLFTQGGGAHNAVWSKIRADRHRRPIAESTHSEAAYGTALVALRAIQ